MRLFILEQFMKYLLQIAISLMLLILPCAGSHPGAMDEQKDLYLKFLENHKNIPGADEPRDEYVKFDSYFNASAPKFKNAHLDNFAKEIKKRPTEKAYVISYAGNKDSKGESLRNLLKIQNYLVKRKKINSNQLVFLDGGCRKEGMTDFYFVPHDAPPPTPSPTSVCKE